MTKQQKTKKSTPKWLVGAAAGLAATTIIFAGLFTWKSVATSNGYVKVSFDTSIGCFSDQNISKTMYVKRGTKLSEIKIERPAFDVDQCFSSYSFGKRVIEYWTDKADGKVVKEDTPMTQDLDLVANYCPLSSLKDLCLGVSFDNLVRAMGQIPSDTELPEYYFKYVQDISSYDTPAQIVARTMLVNKTISQWIVFHNDAKDFAAGAVNYIDIITDQRAQSIASLYIETSSFPFSEKDDRIRILNYLYSKIKGSLLEYTHWCRQVCIASALALSNATEENVKTEFAHDLNYFVYSIDKCYEYDSARIVSEIGAAFFDETKEYTSVQNIRSAFYDAKASVEELLSWEK